MSHSVYLHNMKVIYILAATALLLSSCGDKTPATVSNPIQLEGTWKLVSANMYQQGDTTSTYPVPGQEMIKIFNGQHFAFFKHDTNKGIDSTAVFDAGAGTYTLDGDVYKEELQYCSARGWEGHKFEFRLRQSNDTLIQQGIEKIDSLNINREIVETYIRLTTK